MGRYARKREGSGELAAAAAKRRRKTALEESEMSTSSAQLKSEPENEALPEISGDSSCENVNTSGGGLASCCSSSRSREVAEESFGFSDLEKNAVDVEHFATSAGYSVDFRDRRDNAPPSGVQTESGELEATAGLTLASDSRLTPMTEIMPNEAELEEFFAAAEKKIQEKFMERYNYDIVKDEPVKGHYEWFPVELKR